MAGDPAVRIPTRRKIVYAAVLMGLLFLVCETGLRVRAWMKYGSPAAGVRDPMLTYDSAAGIFVLTPGYEVTGRQIHIKVNSLGFRGEEFNRVKPPGTFRIAVLGASTTFNAEVSSNDMTWPHLLQEKLRQANPGVKIEVINTAVGGYVSTDNLKNLRSRVLQLDPDLVIYYEANNEIVKDTQELALKQGLITGGREPEYVRTISRYSLLFDLAYKNLAILWRSHASAAGKIDKVPPDLPNHFIGVLDEMRTTLAAKNIPLMLSTFIVKYRRNQDRPTQIANADVAFYYMPWMSIDGMLDAMDVYNQAILDYAKRENLPVVDDREAIPPDAQHFTDCMHLGDKGAEAMAERFARYFTASYHLERRPIRQ